MRFHIKIRCILGKETLLVSHINVDALLGLPSLVNHHCTIDFKLPIVQIKGKSLKCIDRHGWMLNSNVQVQQQVKILHHLEPDHAYFQSPLPKRHLFFTLPEREV